MKAIILNSGIGKRMGVHSENKPKCLVELTPSETILSRQIQSLLHYDINKLIMTIGPFEEKIKDFIKLNYPTLQVAYVYNPQYLTTNYIYSIYLISRDLIDDTIILMHGDMIFEQKILKKLIYSGYQNAVLVNSKVPPPKKDFKGKIENGIVREIGVNLFGSGCFLLMPLYKFSKQAFLTWMDEIEKFVNNGKTTVYAENAFNKISDQIVIKPIYFDEELCMEIDTIDDLNLAQVLLNKRE